MAGKEEQVTWSQAEWGATHMEDGHVWGPGKRKPVDGPDLVRAGWHQWFHIKTMRMEREVNYSCMIYVWVFPEYNEIGCEFNVARNVPEEQGMEREYFSQAPFPLFRLPGVLGRFWLRVLGWRHTSWCLMEVCCVFKDRRPLATLCCIYVV